MSYQLNEIQFRCFNAGQAKAEKQLCYLLGDRIIQEIETRGIDDQQDLFDHLESLGIRTIRGCETWARHHLDSVCQHHEGLQQLVTQLWPKQQYNYVAGKRRSYPDWIPGCDYEAGQYVKRVENHMSKKITTRYVCINTHHSSHMFSLDYKRWAKC